jgi:hypothetical protein
MCRFVLKLTVHFERPHSALQPLNIRGSTRSVEPGVARGVH